jgi:WD40 repeat protein
MIELSCSGCGATLEVQDRSVGQRVMCAECGAPTLVPPAADEAATVPPAPPDETVTRPPRPATAESDQTTLPPSAAYSVAGAAVGVSGYEILGELGRGGMGVVYRARQTKLGRLVALKMILSGGHAGEADLTRFRTEAEAIARLQHPNIVQIHEVGEQGGLPFFSLEFCAGGSLEKKLAGTPLPPKEAAALVETLARAMDAAHQKGVIHRDLKPANVLLTEDGTPKITDFGLAKKLDEAGQTASGAVMGTPSYMAPEQAGGRVAEIGPAADVYALGAILYECLTGRPPFKAVTALDTIMQVVSDEPVRPTQLQPKVPRDLETVCLKCLHKEPARRYESAAALADELRRFLEGRPIVARPVGRLERAARWARRNPAVSGLMAAVALALLSGAAVASLFAVRADWEATEARTAKLLADRSAEEARTSARLALQRSYVSDLRLVQGAWEDCHMGLVVELLDAQRPERTGGEDLRGFEWHYWWRLSHFALHTFQVRGSQFTGLAFSPDGKRVARAGEGKVNVWDLSTDREVLSLDSDIRAGGVAFSPDVRRIAVAYLDGTVKVWDVATGQESLTLKGHTGFVYGVAFSPDGKRLASTSSDHTVRVWDAQTGRPALTLAGHGAETFRTGFGVAFSADGKRLAGAFQDGTVKVWDAGDGQLALTLMGHTESVRKVVFSPDGRRLASASDDKTVKVWDTETGKERFTLRGHRGLITAVAFSPDSVQLASGGDDGMVKLWSATNGHEGGTLRGHSGSILTLAFSPDGRSLASEGQDRTVNVWDVQARQEPLSFTGHTGGVRSLVFSPDGRLLAGASDDTTVKVWDASTGREALSFWGHAGGVWQVAFSPDGKRLASASPGHDEGGQFVPGEAKVWDLATGRVAATIPSPGGGTYGVAFSPDGRRLVGLH